MANMDEWEQILGNPAIENAAIKFIIDCEQREGRTARDARGSVLGGAGDVESDGRIIEVKAFSKWGLKSTGLLLFTPGQLREGERNENYYVYVVENVAQGDPSKFELRELRGADLQRLFAGAKPQRLYVPVRAADYARLTRLCAEGEPLGTGGKTPGPRTDGPVVPAERAMPILDAQSKGEEMPESLRGLVIAKWERSGRPRWDLAQTVRVTESADEELASRGLNPAPAFRKHRRDGDDVFVRNWTHGARFPFLTR